MIFENLRDELRGLVDRMVSEHGATATIRELLDRAMWTEYAAGPNNSEAVITPHLEAVTVRRLVERLDNKIQRLMTEAT